MSKYDSAASDFRIRRHLSNIANNMIASQKDSLVVTEASVRTPTTDKMTPTADKMTPTADKKLLRYYEFSDAVLRFGIKPTDYRLESNYHIASSSEWLVSQKKKPLGKIKVFRVVGAANDGGLICDVDNVVEYDNLADFVIGMENLESGKSPIDNRG